MHFRLTCSIPSCADLEVSKLLHGLFRFKLRCSLLLKATVRVPVKPGVGAGAEVDSIFFVKNAVLGLGLG